MATESWRCPRNKDWFSLVSSVKVLVLGLDIQGCHRGSETQKHSFTLFKRSHPPSVYICLIIKSICAFNCDPLWVQRCCSNAVRAGVHLINICRPMSHFSKRRQWVFLTHESCFLIPSAYSQTAHLRPHHRLHNPCFHVWIMKLVWKCLKAVFLLMTSRGNALYTLIAQKPVRKMTLLLTWSLNNADSFLMSSGNWAFVWLLQICFKLGIFQSFQQFSYLLLFT